MFNLSTVLAMNLLRFFIIMLFVSVVSGCGFQLRGELGLSKEISPLYLERNGAFELARELKLLLVTNNISVTDNLGESNSQLTLLREEKNRRVLTIDGDGRAREYLLTYTIIFTVNTGRFTKKESNEKSESISLTRSLLFDPEAVLAVANESEVLYKNMQRNAARLILLKLQAFVRAGPALAPTDQSAVKQ